MSNIEIIDRSTGKIYPEYIPSSGGALTLAEVLKNGNTTEGTKIIATFGAEGEGGIQTDKLDTNVITSLNTGEVFIDSNIGIAEGGKIHYNGAMILESQINEFEIRGIQQSTEAKSNVLAYDLETNKITWQNAGAGSTAVNSISNYPADNSITISQSTGAVEIKLSDKGTIGTYTTPSSMTVDNQGRITQIISGTPVSNWATLPAVTAINAGNNPITNCTGLSSTGYISIGTSDPTKEIIIDSQMRINNKPLILAGLNAPLHAVGGTSTTGTIGQVLSSQGDNATPAWINSVNNITSGTNINVDSTNPLNPVINLNISQPVRLNNNPGTAGQILTSTGTSTAPIWSDKPSGAENWSYFPAVSNVDIDNKDINNCGDINFKSGGRIETDNISGLIIEAPLGAITTKINNNNKLEITETNISTQVPLNMNQNAITNASSVNCDLGQQLLLGTANNNVNIDDTNGLIEVKTGNLKINSLTSAPSTLTNVMSYDPNSKRVYYQPGSTGVVESVNAGSNIFVNNNDNKNPIVSLNVTSDIDMQNHNLNNVTSINSSGTLDINSNQNLTLNSINGNVDCLSDLRLPGKKLKLLGATASLSVGNNEGTIGQVLTSQGTNATPAWTTPTNYTGGNNIAIIPSGNDKLISLSVTNDILMNQKKITNASTIETTTIKPVFVQAVAPNTAVVFQNDINMGSNKITYASNIDGNGSISIGDSTYANAGILVDKANGNQVYLYGNKLNINMTQDLKINGTPGDSGQVLTSQGQNLPPVWSTIDAGTVDTITAGTNIGVNSTDPKNPTVSLDVTGGIDMANQPLSNVGEITTAGVLNITSDDALQLKSNLSYINTTSENLSFNTTSATNINSGTLNLGLTKELKLNNNSGSSGQVLSSQGANLPPVWTNINTGVVDSISAGTGISVNSSNPEIPIITNTGVTALSTSGTGISVSGSTGSIVLQNTGVTRLTAGPNVSLSGSTGDITISATGGGGGGGGTVTSVSGGTNITVTNGTTTPTVSFNPTNGLNMNSNAITNATAINNITFSAPNTYVDATNGGFIVSSSGSELININNTYLQLKRAIQAIEQLQLFKDIYTSGSSGTTGQVLQSNGAGVAPQWVNMISNQPITGGSVPILGDSNGFATAIDFNYYYGGYIV